MDIVYVNKEGENPELRYSLRTLQNITHDNVWVFGGSPSWLNHDTVHYRSNAQRASPYSSTRSHIAAACNTREVSDPFLLWNDDFYVMKPIIDVPIMHRGSLKEWISKTPQARTIWWTGLYETAALINTFEKPDHVEWKSYDIHVPLPIYKYEMKEALRLATKIRTDAVHLRTLYGNIAVEGIGTMVVDPKVTRRKDPFPRGPWLSSGDDTFLSTVEPVLRYLFPDPCEYERSE